MDIIPPHYGYFFRKNDLFSLLLAQSENKPVIHAFNGIGWLTYLYFHYSIWQNHQIKVEHFTYAPTPGFIYLLFKVSA